MAVQHKGLVFDMPDEEYHEVLPPSEAHYSSSQFKDAVEDIEYFYKKYISREIKDEVSSTSQNNFDIGHAYHCKVLEPEKFDASFAVYDGVKRGKGYEAFCEEHKGKKIISQKQYETAMFIANGNKNNSVAQTLLREGMAEVSLFWELHGLNVKVRADWINFQPVINSQTGEVEQVPFIMDLKSTTGNPKNKKDIQKKISSLNYDLSAALYMDVFNSYLASVGEPLIEEWKFCFDSKDTGTSKVWTMTKEGLEIGRRKYMTGLKAIREGMATNWEFADEDSLLEPSGYDVQEWLNKEETITLPPIPVEEADEDLL